MYKAIILDIDGTLLTSKHYISEPTKNALIKAQEKGLKVILASGRPTPGMHGFVKELQLKENGSHIISFNGGKIVDLKTNETVFEQTLSSEDVKTLIDVSIRDRVTLLTYEGDDIITEKSNKYVEYEAELNGISIREIDNLKEYVTFPCVKCLMVGDAEILEDVEKNIKVQLPQYTFARSLPFFLECTPPGIDKAQTLDKLLNHLGLDASEVIACGDGNNDLSMIKYAGLGVAMGNATDQVKAAANYITKTNDEDGIVHVLEKYVF